MQAIQGKAESNNSGDPVLLFQLLGNSSLESHQIIVREPSADDEPVALYVSWAFLSIVIVSFLTMSILILVAAFVIFRQKYAKEIARNNSLNSPTPRHNDDHSSSTKLDNTAVSVISAHSPMSHSRRREHSNDI